MTYQKGVLLILSKNFTTLDFDCKCVRPTCKTTLIEPSLVTSLEIYLIIVGKFKINSAYRCVLHNKEIGGDPNSKHMLGMAADCQSLVGKSGADMATYATQVPSFYVGGIGKYKDFAHVDVRGYRARWANI